MALGALDCEDRVKFAEHVVEAAGVIDLDIEAALISAFSVVRREDFVPTEHRGDVLRDIPVSVGYGFMLMRPSVLARMYGAVGVKRGIKVLEIGSGGGYPAALMASIGCDLFCVEHNAQLARLARRKLDESGYQGVLLRVGDTNKGWKDHAPYQAIVFTFAVEEISAAILEQLDIGGRLIAPVGKQESFLRLYSRNERGKVESYKLEQWNP